MKAPSETGYMAAVTRFDHCRKHVAQAERPYMLGRIKDHLYASLKTSFKSRFTVPMIKNLFFSVLQSPSFNLILSDMSGS